MGDGTGYRKNANNAAAHAMSCSKDGCPNCVKHGLPVLLTIPTLANKKYANTVKGIDKLLKGITPKDDLTDAGYVMRTLRQGYVMAYYETPPAGLANEEGWTIARVNEGGYMTQTTFAAEGVAAPPFKNSAKTSKKDKPFSCSRVAGYAGALLFVIPDAENAGKVWVAFSSHPWSPTVRGNYAASSTLRDKGMTLINAANGQCGRSLPLNATNVGKSVAEYDDSLIPMAFAGNPWPIRAANELSTPFENRMLAGGLMGVGREVLLGPKARIEDAGDIAAAARKAAGTPIESITNGLIVGLADTEGCTTTAAQRRITQCNSAHDWIMAFEDDNGQKSGYRRLQSALTVKGLLKVLESQGTTSKKADAKHRDAQNQSVTYDEFKAMKAAGDLPANAGFLSQSRLTPRIPNPENRGFIKIPTDKQVDRHTANLQDDVKDQLSSTVSKSHIIHGAGEGLQWGNFAKKHPGSDIDWQGFLDAYQCRVDHDKARLAKVELDHKVWLQSEQFNHLYTHHFDENSAVDGLPYARCVDLCLMGGPITENALSWWKPFLAEDPMTKSNLLVRALMGNQRAWLGWFTHTGQIATVWDEMKGLLDIVKEARQNGAGGSQSEAQSLTQSLLETSGAVAALQDKAGQMSQTMRDKLKRLGVSLMGKSEEGLELFKLRVPIGVANRLWHKMADAGEEVIKKTGKKAGSKVESLVLGGALTLEMQGYTKSADALIDVYLWSRGDLKLQAGKVDGKFKLTTANVMGEGQTAFAAEITSETADNLAKNSMRVIRGAASGVLSAGSGFLQVLLIGEAWEQLKTGDKDDREAAALSLISGGLGLSSALMEISANFSKQFAKEALEKGLKVIAGSAAAFATVISAVQAGINAYESLEKGDDAATIGYTVQTVFFLAAAGAGAADIVTEGSMAVVAGLELGLSWTGVGLILVALGALMAFVILLIQDTPMESWAAQTIWGDADDKFPNLGRAQSALNELLVGAKIDFMFGSLLADTWHDGINRLEHFGDALARDFGFGGEYLDTQSVHLRLTVPTKVENNNNWVMQIFATRRVNGVPESVRVAQWGSLLKPTADGDHTALAIYDVSHKEEAPENNPKATRLALFLRVQASQYSHGVGSVLMTSDDVDKSDPYLRHCSLIIDEPHLTD